MKTQAWIRNLFARPCPRPVRKAQHRVRLAGEVLENRTVLSGFAGHAFLIPHNAAALPQSADGNSPAISVPYNGGPLLTNVQVQGVYYNDPATLGLQSQFDGFFSDILQSPWLTQMLASYSVPNYTIGAGSFLGDADTGLTVPEGGILSDATIMSQLISGIANHKLAAPTGNSTFTNVLYAVFVPAGVEVSSGGSNSVNTFYSYHSGAIDPNSGKSFNYMVIPYQGAAPDGGTGPDGPNASFNGQVSAVFGIPSALSEFQELTVALAHELSEAITDPFPFQGWVSATGEIGDVALNQWVTYHGYAMQEEWAHNPTDPPLVALGPAVAPADTDFAVTQIDNPTEGAFNGVFATFTDKDGASESPSQFTVGIDWGDRTSSRSDDGSGDVMVTSNGDGTFNIVGRHRYNAETGTTERAAVFVSSGDEIARTTLPVTLQEAGPLTNLGAHNFLFAAGQALSNQVVATFTDPGGTAGADPDPSEYRASINWGDGTSHDTNVTIWPNGNGHYSVLANRHIYTSAGNYRVSVTITHDDITDEVDGQAMATVPTTFTVTSLLDDGSFGTLRWAVGQVNATVGIATINFASTLFATPQTIYLTGAPLELSNTIATETILGPAAGVTVSGDGLSGVFQVDAGVNASISRLTIIGGKTAGSGAGLDDEGGIAALSNCTVSGNSAGNDGGGLYDDLGVNMLTNCTVSGNSAANNGGGLFNYGAATLANCTVTGNSAAGLAGGLDNNFGAAALTNCTISGNHAIGPGGGLLNYGAATLTNCTVSGNSALASGGGVAAYYGTAMLTNCTVSSNSAANKGGGVATAFFSTTATLTNCTVSGNSAAFAGGVLAAYYGTATLTNCTVSGNSALTNGGGVAAYYGTATLTNSTVSGNSAKNNGGGVAVSGFDSMATMTNCTLSGNSASFSGGGLYNSSAATLTNCTVSSNTATYGGGLFNYGTATLANCTVTRNSATAVGGGLFSGGAATLTNCTVSGDSASYGGGLFSNGTLALTNCTVSGDSASVNGGGAYVNYGTATLANCTISGNTAAGNGGGLQNYAGTATLTDCTVGGNSAAAGGGIDNSGTLNASSCAIGKNQASEGGGIATTSGSVTLTNVTVNKNQAVSSAIAQGGAIYSANTLVSLTNCTVNGNQATGSTAQGGGIYAYQTTVDMKNSTVNANEADGTILAQGGGIYAYQTTVDMKNSSVNGNQANGATAQGGGIYAYQTTVDMKNSSVNGNHADGTVLGQGGGIYGDSTTVLTLMNSTVKGNKAMTSGNDFLL